MAARPANPALAFDILRVTADLIEEKGHDALTMREVAERLGYSATTIYLYFKDKEELIGTTCEETFLGLLRALQAVEQHHKDPLQRLRVGCTQQTQIGRAHV